MNENESRLLSDRANRDAARELVDSGMAQVKADLAARGIGGRIKHTVMGKVEDGVEAGLDVARENKPIVAGTIGLLLVWFLRAPLGRLTKRIFGQDPDEPSDQAEPNDDSDEE